MAALGAPHPHGHVLRTGDALAIQQLVGRLVSGHQQRCQGCLQQIHHALQIAALQAAGEPLLDQMAAHGLAAQNVVGWQFLVFDGLHAQAQRIEDGCRGLPHGQRHAGGQDLVLHHIVAEQFELQRPALRHRSSSRRLGWLQCALQRLHAGIQPGRLVLAVAGPGLATLLHFTCGAHGLGLLFHLGQQLLGHAGQALAQSTHPMQTRLLAQ